MYLPYVPWCRVGKGAACSPPGPFLLSGQTLLHQMVLGRRDCLTALNTECPTTYVKPTDELRTDLWGLKRQKKSCLQIQTQLRKDSHFQCPYPPPSSVTSSPESASNPVTSSDSHRNLKVVWSWSGLTVGKEAHLVRSSHRIRGRMREAHATKVFLPVRIPYLHWLQVSLPLDGVTVRYLQMITLLRRDSIRIIYRPSICRPEKVNSVYLRV